MGLTFIFSQGDEDILKGAEQTMNGIEKVFESMSSSEKDFGHMLPPNAIVLEEEANMDSNMFVYNSDDQRYSNTISSTSSTRSGGGGPTKHAKSKGLNSFVHMGSKSKQSKAAKHSSPSQNEDFDQQQQQQAESARKLSEMDMKKAINRYGTIPKGTQINAYLDSLQANDNFADMDVQPLEDSPSSSNGLYEQEPDILTLQHPPSISSLPVSSFAKHSTTTFSKDTGDKPSNVFILDDISNHHHHHSEFKPAGHFPYTRQKSDLTHSKTSENVAFNGGGAKVSKGSVRVARNNKNHLQLLKSVASPRLPLKSDGSTNKDGVGDDDHLLKSFNEMMPTEQFPLPPPAQFCGTDQSELIKMSKSGSFDFTSFPNHFPQHKIPFDPNSEAGEVVVTLDKIINSEDFPPPPTSLEFNDQPIDTADAPINTTTVVAAASIKLEEQQQKVKVGKKKEDKKKKDPLAKSNVASKAAVAMVKPDLPKLGNNNAFMSELYESFRMKAQKDAASTKAELKAPSVPVHGKDAKLKSSLSTKPSFLFKRTVSKPEPDCPAPAVPASQSKFYTKDSGDTVGNSNPSVDAEYVTPVLKKASLKPVEPTPKQQQPLPLASQATEESKPKSKPSKLAMLFNSGNSKSNSKHKSDGKKVEMANPVAEQDNHLSKSVISNSGYDADDESKRHSAGSISNYKKFWESQSVNVETDSGIGSCSSSNVASKSNDSVISMGSIGSNGSATKVATSAMSSPKLRGGPSRIPTATATASFLKKNSKLSEHNNSCSVDNIPRKCSNDENADQEASSKPT